MNSSEFQAMVEKTFDDTSSAEYIPTWDDYAEALAIVHSKEAEAEAASKHQEWLRSVGQAEADQLAAKRQAIQEYEARAKEQARVDQERADGLARATADAYSLKLKAQRQAEEEASRQYQAAMAQQREAYNPYDGVTPLGVTIDQNGDVWAGGQRIGKAMQR